MDLTLNNRDPVSGCAIPREYHFRQAEEFGFRDACGAAELGKLPNNRYPVSAVPC